MNPEDLRDLLRTRPFRPFRLYMKEGEPLDVTYPNMVILTRRLAMVGVSGKLDQGLPERVVQVALVNIERFELLKQSQTGGQAVLN